MTKQRLWFHAIHVLAWGLLLLTCSQLGAPVSAHESAVPPAPPLSAAVAATTPACNLAWHAVAAPALTYQGVAAHTATDAWAVASPGPAGAGTILHWDGTTWQPVVPPTPPFAGVSDTYYAVAADGPGAAWIAGAETTAGDFNPGIIFRVTVPAATPGPSAMPTKGSPFGGVAVYYFDRAVAVTGPGDAWVVGNETSQFPEISGAGALGLHCTLTGCSSTAVVSPNTSAALYAIAAAGPADIWAAGTYVATAAGPYVGLLEHYDGTAWHMVTAPEIGPINGLAAPASNDVWAVGNGGIIHWNGATWSPVPVPNAGPLRAITMPAADDGWVAGETGLLHWDGIAWTLAPGPPGVISLSADSHYDIWAATTTALYHYSATPTFADVPVAQPFYPYVEDLACRGAVSGYTCGAPGEPCPGSYYRPSANVTRGQLAKIIANTAALTDTVPPTQQTFRDVPLGHPFWLFVERLAQHNAVSGYTCGAPGEPCPGVYFRPGATATRGQIAKIVATAAELAGVIPTTQQTFVDVPPTQPFWVYIERLAARGGVSGYACGGPGAPCPGFYFRSGAETTRGQMAKIAATTFVPAVTTARK